ncbi:uncharacterized protein Eint_061590 [Encephalitozoon intestinalis ATCC 50506]|uniref:Uncharacterized protein n=1 Tax=Encephalitozoon intestinalis (strain ATCC 50506) TaxID=876142 RepID=E0S7C8_ENCIT|nr:uncharacterized protein Eint_061590 [Encephalitozoon intestinalis ATCC 50506]ADM11763.1 hypothetical protein Eint_061590 [Encephalitozoon intestinalis ATCC 50506]UTX45504.1 DUF3654 domain-containing protein [Encephalitozoon intestinalis]
MQLVWIFILFDILFTSAIEEVKKAWEKGMSRELNSSEVKRLEEELGNVAGMDMNGLIPLIFHENEVIVSPVTKYRDIEDSKRKYVENIIERLPSLAWESMVGIYVPKHADWIWKLMNDIFFKGKYRDNFDVLDTYRGGKSKRLEPRLVDLIMNIFKRNAEMLKDFGESLSNEAKKKMGEISKNMDSKKREKEEEILTKVQIYGKSLCTKSKKEQIIKAQKIVCDACVYLWERERQNKLPS